jgi:hypothetical protein
MRSGPVMPPLPPLPSWQMFAYLDTDAKREGTLYPHDSLTLMGLKLFKVKRTYVQREASCARRRVPAEAPLGPSA